MLTTVVSLCNKTAGWRQRRQGLINHSLFIIIQLTEFN